MAASHFKVTVQTLRRFILGQQGLWPGRRWQGKAGTAQAIRAMGAVQIDPLLVIARNHDLILHSRVVDYQPDHLNELLYQERLFFDYGGILQIYPMEELPYWKIHMQRHMNEAWWHAFMETNQSLVDTVRAEIKARGPLGHRDLKSTTRVENYRARKDTGLAMYYLWRVGELMTAGRRGFDRLYDFAEHIAPEKYLKPMSETDAEAFFIRKALHMDGLPRFSEWRRGFAYFARRTVSSAEMKERVSALIATGDVTAVEIEGMKDLHYTFTRNLTDLETLEIGQVPAAWTIVDSTAETEVNFLAPLDPVSARGRAAKLFNFDYKWEIYTPVEKRRWGYYVLPILYGNELVGRMDVKLNRATKTLIIKGFWLENSSTGEDTAFVAALVRGLIRFTHFHGVTQLDAQKVSPATLGAAELFTDSGITLI